MCLFSPGIRRPVWRWAIIQESVVSIGLINHVTRDRGYVHSTVPYFYLLTYYTSEPSASAGRWPRLAMNFVWASVLCLRTYRPTLLLRPYGHHIKQAWLFHRNNLQHKMPRNVQPRFWPPGLSLSSSSSIKSVASASNALASRTGKSLQWLRAVRTLLF